MYQETCDVYLNKVANITHNSIRYHGIANVISGPH